MLYISLSMCVRAAFLYFIRSYFNYCMFIMEFFKFHDISVLGKVKSIRNTARYSDLLSAYISDVWFTGSLLFSILKIFIMRSRWTFSKFYPHLLRSISSENTFRYVWDTLQCYMKLLLNHAIYSTCAPRVTISTYRPFTQSLIVAHLFVVAYTIK